MSKKKKQKTVEELLKEVLVRLKEQPYNLPSNWCWVNFDSSVDSVSNRGKQLKQREYKDEGRYPVVDQGQKKISGYTDDEELVYSGDLPVVIFGDHTRTIKWVDFEFVQGADGTKILKPKEFFDPKFLYFLLNVLNLPDKGYSRHFKFLRESPLVLPPINEQKRIVDKLESLLNKIDEAKQLIEEAKETFELRRSAILDRAFRGEFSTTDHTEFKMHKSTNYKIPDDWRFVNVEDLCELISDCPHSTPKYIEDGEYPAIRTSDVHFGVIDTSRAKRVSEKDYIERTKRTVPQRDDIIYCREGTVGNAGIIKDEKVCLAQRVVLLRPNKDKVLPKYLVYVLNSPMMRKQVFSNISQTTSPRINISTLKKLILPIAPLEIQNSIVNIIEKCLEIEQESRLLLQAEHLEGLKQAVLSKAFRGELDTNDPTEDRAIELLKEVLHEQVK